ncbi:MAG: hypothetical protein ACRD2Y_17240 [Terriglobales bacterium]
MKQTLWFVSSTIHFSATFETFSMTTVEKNGLYVSSWEYLYLGEHIPRGLPNQLFSQHPWLLILFENIYCDENALKAEWNAYQALQWTNSKLFAILGSSERGIIQALPMQSYLAGRAGYIRNEVGVPSPADFQMSLEDKDDHDLLVYKTAILEPFLDQYKLCLYDWSLSVPRPVISEAIEGKVKNVIRGRCPKLLLTLDMSELNSANKQVFRSLLEFERQGLAKIRRGLLDQERDVLPHLKKRLDDYRKIDIELSEGLEERLGKLLLYRDRFGRNGGWGLVSRYLEAMSSAIPVPPAELGRMLGEIEQCLDRSLGKPTLPEYGKAIWSIVKEAAHLIPGIHQIMTGASMKKESHHLQRLLEENLSYYRGDSRQKTSGKVLDI